MKISALVPVALAVGLIGTTVLPAAAMADRTVTTTRTTVRHTDNGRRGWHTRRVCSMQYHHHHRVRVCRTVRYR